MSPIARCGCVATDCTCVVQAGDDSIEVTGNGSLEQPYRITATRGNLEVDATASVFLTLSGGTGGALDPQVLVADVRRSAIAGNMITEEPDGLAVTCEAVQDCVGAAVGAGEGLEYDDAGNAISADLSADANNVVSFGTDGGLYVPAGGVGGVFVDDSPCIAMAGDGSVGSPITPSLVVDPIGHNLLACDPTDGARALFYPGGGLTGRGWSGDPTRVNTDPWAWPCDIISNGQPLGIDANGKLWAPPVQSVLAGTDSQSYTPPGGTNANGFSRTFTYNYTNPSDCRPMTGGIWFHALITCVMQPGTEIIATVGGADLARYRMDGPAARTSIKQIVATSALVIAAGGGVSTGLTIELSVATGSATVSQVSSVARVMGVAA